MAIKRKGIVMTKTKTARTNSSSGRSRSSKRTSSSRGSRTKRGSGRRELITPRGDARYVRRDGQGQFKESDDLGRSLSVDRRRQAKRKVKSGHGDRVDG